MNRSSRIMLISNAINESRRPFDQSRFAVLNMATPAMSRANTEPKLPINVTISPPMLRRRNQASTAVSTLHPRLTSAGQ
ncbi:hypothetical protein KDW_64200 [Dictyobacter vulcani]|uniref:Uncharacterized protein n=1 Tax=Dictyobacter vulcani TaxID=2607529 RepID=A0A5J4KRC1_9CHLR|nr:hypothetical protein KDW_64200 [Dictyobacter vulcani]